MTSQLGPTDYKTERVREFADQLRKQIQGGTLYGYEINLQDTDQILVAAYFRGRADGYDRRKKDEIPKDLK